jgi:hypothetical protein
MQKRISECVEGRPRCHRDERHPVHRHGSYKRYANANDEAREKVERFLCCPCGRTFSALSAQQLPYVSLPTDQLEAQFDARSENRPLPPVTEKEKGCAQRAWTRFAHRVETLTAVLGQMIPVVKPTAAALWRALRPSRSLADILHLLSRHFHTSLLGDYACLQPWTAPAGSD